MRNKICVYTVVTAGYDDVKKPLYLPPGIDYYVVTDDAANKIPGYKTVLIETNDPVKSQRQIKAYPYDVLPGYEVYLYYDCSYQIRRNILALLRVFRGGFGVKRHPSRDCVYQEAHAIISLKKATKEAVDEQVAAYRELGVPENFGLQETGILMRDSSEQTKLLCAQWAEEISTYTHRDQLGLPAAIFKTGVQPTYYNSTVLNQHFRQHPHKSKISAITDFDISSEKPHIAYLQPFSSDVNIGGEYNYHIETVRPSDWVCIMDHDVCFLHPKTKQQIEDVVNGYGKEFDLLSCYTNRIGSAHQRYMGEMSANADISYHMKIASKLHDELYGQVKQIKQGVAGFLMLFRKSLWEQIKFKQNTPHFDTYFSKEVLKMGKRVGLMKGVYVWHTYRLWSDQDVQRDLNHLNPVKHDSRPDSSQVLPGQRK